MVNIQENIVVAVGDDGDIGHDDYKGSTSLFGNSIGDHEIMLLGKLPLQLILTLTARGRHGKAYDLLRLPSNLSNITMIITYWIRVTNSSYSKAEQRTPCTRSNG